MKILSSKRHGYILEKWQSRFSKRNTTSTQIGGNTDSHDVADCFQRAFSDCCFDSYDDAERVMDLNMKIANMNDDDL